MPSSCRITEYASTQNNINIRIDSAVKAVSDVSMFYDPMIAKLCTYHNTRQKTIECMFAALEAFIRLLSKLVNVVQNYKCQRSN
ncbi:hypothetical protein ACA348_09645 [Orientia tsutsugamushi]